MCLGVVGLLLLVRSTRQGGRLSVGRFWVLGLSVLFCFGSGFCSVVGVWSLLGDPCCRWVGSVVLDRESTGIPPGFWGWALWSYPSACWVGFHWLAVGPGGWESVWCSGCWSVDPCGSVIPLWSVEIHCVLSLGCSLRSVVGDPRVAFVLRWGLGCYLPVLVSCWLLVWWWSGLGCCWAAALFLVFLRVLGGWDPLHCFRSLWLGGRCFVESTWVRWSVVSRCGSVFLLESTGLCGGWGLLCWMFWGLAWGFCWVGVLSDPWCWRLLVRCLVLPEIPGLFIHFAVYPLAGGVFGGGWAPPSLLACSLDPLWS